MEPPCNGRRVPSLRGAKRRSNPWLYKRRYGLLRFARNDDRQLFLLVRMAMHGIDPEHRLRLLDRLDIEIDGHRLSVGAHQHAFQDLVRTGIDLLVRHIGRHEDEVAGAGFRGELQLLAPAHPRLALHDIDDAFQMAMMMRAGLGVGPDRDGAGPELLCAGAREIDRGLAIHARRRRNVWVELVARNDANAVMFPALVVVVVVGVRMRMVVRSGHEWPSIEFLHDNATELPSPGPAQSETFLHRRNCS